MTQPSLKIGPLPDRTPVKLNLSIDPSLRSDLEDYAAVYAEAFGERPGIEALVPVMLEAFLASDTGFRRARRQLHSSPTPAGKDQQNGDYRNV